MGALDLVERRLTDEEAREQGIAFIVSGAVPQAAFYTVGWHMAATVERELGKERLVATLCDPLQFLVDYNRSVERASSRALSEVRPALPTWSDSLLRRLRD